MPLQSIESLDDPLTWDATASFSGGQSSATRANLLKQDEFSHALNCDISSEGLIITRRGTTLIGPAGGYVQGLIHFDTPTFSRLVGWNQGLFSLDGTIWVGHGTFGYTNPFATMAAVQGVNKLYFTDGTVPIQVFDGTTITALTGSGNTNAPVSPTVLAWHTDRLCAAGFAGEPDTIYFSQFLEGRTWDRSAWNVRVGTGEGDAITGLVPWTNYNLVVLKRRSLWIVNTNPTQPPSDFRITPVHRLIGCVAPRTAVQVGADIMLLTDSGVRSINRTLASEQQNEVGEAISEPVKDIIERITPSEVQRCHATYWNNRYMLALPLDGATAPNYVLIYNTITNTWSGIWDGWMPTVFAVRSFANNSPRLCIGQSNGSVLEWQDWVPTSRETDEIYTDNGEAIPIELTLRAFTFNEPACQKTGYNCEFEFNGSNADVKVYVILDDGDAREFVTIPTLSESLTLPLTLPFELPRAGIVRRSYGMMQFGRYRELQYELKTTGGKMALRSVAASAYIDALVPQTA